MAACSIIIKIWTGSTAFHRGLIPCQEAAPTQQLVCPVFHTQGGYPSRLSQQHAASADMLLECSCFQQQHLHEQGPECGCAALQVNVRATSASSALDSHLGRFASDQSDGGIETGLFGWSLQVPRVLQQPVLLCHQACCSACR